LRKIEARPPRYFSKESKKGIPVLTENKADAISETAINPAETYYHDISTDAPQSTMTIFRAPEGLTVEGKAVSAEALALLYSQKLVHEYTHTFINDIFIRRESKFRLQKGPISTYHAAYRNGNDFQADPVQPVVRNTALTESLAEAITAKIVGFTFSADVSRRFAPFFDRAEIEQFVDTFLAAEPLAPAIPTPQSTT